MTNRRDARIAKRATRTTTTAPDTAIVTADVATAPDAPALARVLTFTDYGMDVAPVAIPAHIPAFVTAFRAVAAMPSKTMAERTAVRDAFIASVTASGIAATDGTARHTGRFSRCPVFVAQNDMYVAMALANVVVPGGVVMAAWAAEFPNATCGRTVPGCDGVPYIGRDYAGSTLSEYINGRHGASSINGAVAIVTAWAKRGGKPIA